MSSSTSTPTSRRRPFPSRRSRTLNFDQIEEDAGHRRKKRRKSSAQDKLDTKIVTGPVLKVFDQLCGPKHSPTLFRRRYKSKANPDGTRSLKKNCDIVMSKFKQLVRPVLRSILGRPDIQPPPNVADKHAWYTSLYNRFYKAALRVVKKRRANHVQHWRLYGRAKPMIYKMDINSLLPVPPPVPATAGHAPIQGDHAPVPPATAAQDDHAPVPPATVAQDVHDAVDMEDSEFDDEPEFDPFEPQQEQSVESQAASFRCASCQQGFPMDKGFPVGAKKKRCEPCHKKYMAEEVICHVRSDEQREKLLQTMSGGEQQSQSRRTIAFCKWCKSTTHKTKRSKDCPFNKNNVAAAAAAATTTTDAVPVATTTTTTNAAAATATNNVDAATATTTTTNNAATATTNAVAAAAATTTANNAAATTNVAVTATTNAVAAAAATTTANNAAATNNVAVTATTNSVAAAAATTTTNNAAAAIAINNNAAAATNAAVATTNTYRVGDNVLARDGRGWYLAHVCQVQPAHIRCYFPCDGKVSNLRPHHVREYNGLPQPTRGEMIGKTFHYEGDDDIPPSTWKVRRMINQQNEYVCVKLDGGGDINIDNFDIGFVMNTIRSEEEHARQFGM